MSDTENRTRIAIDLPLPLDVAGTLTKLIGTAYPSAVIDANNSGAFGRQLVLLVDDRDRKRLPGKKRIAEEIKDYEPDDPIEGGNLTKIDPQGWSFAPVEEVQVALGVMCQRVLEAGGDNYLEWQVADPEDRSKVYVLSAARSKGQTPHALRQKAQARIDRVRALLNKPGSVTKEALREALGD